MIGKEIGNYKIVKELGRGGMGVVYKAHHLSLGRMVAMKVLPQHLSADPSFIRRFENEARAIAKLNHPNIVQIYDIGHEGDIYYYTMEFLEGPSLDQVIYRENTLPLDRALNTVAQAARALQYAHSQGIVHRDIKPSNIIFDHTNRAKITDFGLALQERSTRLTVDGSIVGTPEYMSPEQAAAEPATCRSDIYSLGVVFYELLTGKIPFEGETALVILKKVQSLDPAWPRSHNPQIPIEVERVIQRMMARKPRDRYANCEDIIRDLRRVKAGQPILPEKRRLPGFKIAATMAGFLLLGAVIFYRFHQQSSVQAPVPAIMDAHEAKPLGASPGEIPPLPPPPAAAPSTVSPPPDELALVKQNLNALQERLDVVRSQKPSPDALWADTVIFKKGNRINCVILNESLEKVRIQTASGFAEVPREEVKLLVYAAPEKKRVAEEARSQEEQRLQEEQQVRNDLVQLEQKKDDLEKRLQPAPVQLGRPVALQQAPEPSAEREEGTQPRNETGNQKESLSLQLKEGSWHVSSFCGKKSTVSFSDNLLAVTTSQNSKEIPCSIVLDYGESLDGHLHSVEILLEVKRLVLANDHVTASFAVTFTGGKTIEYILFDSDQEQLAMEIRETSQSLRISRPENGVLLDTGLQVVRLPIANDSGKISEGEKPASISLILSQSNGKAVFVFRYKAIVLNMM